MEKGFGMKIKKKHIELTNGFIRFKNDFEMNWNLTRWVLVFGIEIHEYLVSVDILCLTLFFPRNNS